MRILLFLGTILSSSLAIAQSSPFQNQQQTTGVIGITSGQTARLNVLYPTAPAPLLLVRCSANLGIFDDQGGVLKSQVVPELAAGKSVSLDVNADTDLPGASRTEIHAFTVTPSGCRLVTTLEIIDNASQKTVAIVGSIQTYPFAQIAPMPLPPATTR